jgi:hypothetical protein
LENGSPLATGSAASLSVAGKAAAGTYVYVRVVANSACTLTLNRYTVTVLAPGAEGQAATCGCMASLCDSAGICAASCPNCKTCYKACRGVAADMAALDPATNCLCSGAWLLGRDVPEHYRSLRFIWNGTQWVNTLRYAQVAKGEWPTISCN